MQLIKKIRSLQSWRNHKKAANNEKKVVRDNWWHISRKILPPSVSEEGFDHLSLTDGTFIKCLIVGVPYFGVPGYSRTIDPGFIGSLLNTAQDKCFIGYSFALSPFSQADSNMALEEAEFRNVRDQVSDADMNDMKHIRNKTKFVASDIEKDQLEIHNQIQKQYFTSCVITIRAYSLHELDVSYSYVATILSNNLIGYLPADGNMLEVYKSAQPWGTPLPEATVDCLSSQVASLLPVKRLESKTADTGLWIGNHMMKNHSELGKEIVIDLSALSAEHSMVFGPTGAGKTAFMIVAGMRAHDQLGYRIIYITVKADTGTQFRNMPKYYRNEGSIVDLGYGAGKQAVNPLQIIFDASMVEGSHSDHLRIFHKHKMVVTSFFDAFLKTGLTDNQSFYLDKTLNEVYEKHGLISIKNNRITCNYELWNDGKNFPTIHELRELWESEMKGRQLKRLYESAESLYNRTGQLGKLGAYSYVNTKSTVDLSSSTIVIDLSGMDENIQNAMSVLMIEAVGARFDTDASRKTLLLIDEGVTFSHTEKRQNFISNAYMMGRSGNVAVMMSFTHPGNISKEFATMLKTNSMWSMIFGKGIETSSVEYMREFFRLKPEDETVLTNSSIGEGLLTIGNQIIPSYFKITEQEMKILKGTDDEDEITSTDGGLVVLDILADLVVEHGVCLDEWVKDPNTKVMRDLEYEPHLVQRVASTGKAKAWIQSDMVKDGHILNQTTDHYCSVIQIAGYLLQKGFNDVRVSHFDDVDVSATLGDESFSFEYERQGSHTERQLSSKKNTIESTGSRCFFVCQKSYELALGKAVGSNNVYTRGVAFTAAIDAVLEEHNQNKKEDKTDE